jgi:hypothetical protein
METMQNSKLPVKRDTSYFLILIALAYPDRSENYEDGTLLELFSLSPLDPGTTTI